MNQQYLKYSITMTSWSANNILAIVELIIYSILLLPSIYVAFKHGKTGMVAWATLVSLCAMRIGSSSIIIYERNKVQKQGAGLSITTSGTIDILVLLPIGLIYEA
jgi:hypothetical protein